MTHSGTPQARWATAVVTILLLVTTLAAVPALKRRAAAEVGPGGFRSANVTWVAHLPIDAPGTGGRVVQVGAQTRFYVTGPKGLTIWDVTKPELPTPIGALALPHWENEDVAVSKDGSTVIVAHDGNFQLMENEGFPTYVIDTSNPATPLLASIIDYGSHTITCADDACNILYSSEGWTWDITDRAAPKRVLPNWTDVLRDQGVVWKDSVHDLNRDAAGYVITDSTPRVMFDPRPNPAKPKLLTQGPVPSAARLAYQHNNIRIDADKWKPLRPSEDTGVKKFRPGELMLSNGETNFGPRCGAGSGPLASWSVRDWDKGVEMKPLDVYRPVNGTYENGNPAVNGMGCSGHWFTYRNGLVAAAWYDHGTRFFDVDKLTGKIIEIGFFQPVAGEASAAHWINDEYVYVVDYARGIDVLKIDRLAARPSQAQVTASWLGGLGGVKPAGAQSSLGAVERYRCGLAQQ